MLRLQHLGRYFIVNHILNISLVSWLDHEVHVLQEVMVLRLHLLGL